MRRGNSIGRVRRLRAIRPVFLTACDNSGRIKSHQATAFSGEPKTPVNFNVRLVGQVLRLGTQRANLNFQDTGELPTDDHVAGWTVGLTHSLSSGSSMSMPVVLGVAVR